MIRQELVAKDLIQKGERHKTVAQKCPYHEGESITNFQSNAPKIKNRKTRRPDSTVMDLYFSLLRTSLNFRHSFDSHTPLSN